MNDIVERLRVLSSQGDPTIENEAADRIVLLEGQLVVAADEIERLRVANKRLEEQFDIACAALLGKADDGR